MGARTREVYGVYGKIKDWWVHLRTRPSIGAGRDRHGREHPPNMQAMCDYENQERPFERSQSKENEKLTPWVALIKDPATSWETFQMEEETKRTISPQKQWRMTMNKGQMQTALSKVSDTFAKLDDYNFKHLLGNTAVFANMKLENPVDEWSLAIIMSAFADAKISIMPEKVEAYRESMMWTAIAADLKEEKRNQLPRVNAAIEAALNTVTFTEPSQ